MRRRMIRAAGGLLVILLSLAAAAPGSEERRAPDRFGLERINGGIDVLRQPDGKLVVVGATGVCETVYAPCGLFTAVRFLPGGRPDLSFGNNGVAIAPGFGAALSDASAGALGQDGDIVIAGTTYVSGSGSDFAIARFNADGVADTSFAGDGPFVTEGLVGSARDVAVTPAGDVVIGGSSLRRDDGGIGESRLALVKVTSGGELDHGFGDEGITLTDYYPDISSGAEATALELGPSGSILAAGEIRCHEAGCASGFGVARYTADGLLDNSFGSEGRSETAFAVTQGVYGPEYATPTEILPLAEGGFLVAGDSGIEGAGRDHRTKSAYALYSAGGTLDPVFSGDGTANGTCNSARTIARTPSGYLSAGISYFWFSDEWPCLEQISAGGVVEQALPAQKTTESTYVSPSLLAPEGIFSAGFRFRPRRVGGPEGPLGIRTSFVITKHRFGGALDRPFGRSGIRAMPEEPLCRGRVPTLIGTPGPDRITTGRYYPVILAGAGADTVSSGQEADIVCGGLGPDRIRLGRGNDTGVGGVGPDRLFGGRGDDDLFGAAGRDLLRGGPGKDRLRPGPG